MSLLDTKNLSPRQISLITAFVVACFNALMSLALRPEWQVGISVFLVSFAFIYYIFHYSLQRFIYRKIKLIYKFIYQTKASRKEEFFYRDILPQKSIEEVSKDVLKWAARKREEVELLKENEKFRKEFLMNLAHELRTPIFTVQGYIDTLLDGGLDDPEVNRRFLQNASKGIDRLVRLVADLGEISRLESGRIPIITENFVIQDLVAEVYEEFSMKASEKQLIMTFKKGTESPLLAAADREKIKQVLVNLIENAIKYSNEAGTITAGCYVVDDRHIYVEISDDGPGIAEEHLPRIFERFYRADRSRSRSVGGTGLGLAIVKHIVEAHGQTVTVRSKPGVGSSFGFTLERSNTA